MKKIILLTILVHFTILAFTQKLTLTEMIEKTKCKSFTEFNNFIVKKGFSYRGIDSTCCQGYLFLFNSDKLVDTLGDGYIYGTQSQFLMKENEKKVTFITRTKTNYLPFLNQLQKLGFKIISEIPNQTGSGMTTTYSSAKYKNIEVQIAQFVAKDKNDNNYTAYYISAARKF